MRKAVIMRRPWRCQIRERMLRPVAAAAEVGVGVVVGRVEAAADVAGAVAWAGGGAAAADVVVGSVEPCAARKASPTSSSAAVGGAGSAISLTPLWPSWSLMAPNMPVGVAALRRSTRTQPKPRPNWCMSMDRSRVKSLEKSCLKLLDQMKPWEVVVLEMEVLPALQDV